MKVIKKQAIKQGSWKKKLVCKGGGYGKRGCGSQLMVEEDDLFAFTTAVYNAHPKATFECMVCGQKTTVENTGEIRVGQLPDYTVWNRRKQEQERERQRENEKERHDAYTYTDER